MRIYPKDIFEIYTDMSAAEIYSALDAVVEPPQWFRMSSESGKKFQGEFSSSGFKIMRIISYRNSFLPVIEGTVTPTISGSRISVTMRLHRYVGIFMLLWLGGVSIGLVTFLLAVLNGKTEPLPTLLVPLGMLLFGIVMTSGCFWWEARKTKPVIMEMFNMGKQRTGE
jgi:hypothetical protein